jgi:large subunit ribosomal protein L25
MEHPVLEAIVRQDIGRSAARESRRSGRIPAVLYGRGEATVAVEVDARQLERMLHRGLAQHGMLDLELKEAKSKERRTVLIREVQHHPVTGEILHADFYHVEMGQRIETSIPVVLVGQAEGVKKGGILEHLLRELEIECVAEKMPENVTLDVTQLELGHSLHVRDLAMDEDVSVLTEPDRTVVAVVPPRLREEVAPAAEVVAEEEVAEPEVVGKKPKEEEEEAEESEEKRAHRERREP